MPLLKENKIDLDSLQISRWVFDYKLLFCLSLFCMYYLVSMSVMYGLLGRTEVVLAFVPGYQHSLPLVKLCCY